jgi:hypothetical protein
MSDPISFTSSAPRFGIPFLFAGQAQYVNEAHALVDLLLHPAIESETDTPPSAPQEGWSAQIQPQNGLQRVASPAIPNSGQIVDTEARDAIGNLVETLRNAGILPAS